MHRKWMGTFALAAALAGCGSSGGTTATTATTASLTRAQLRTRADTICKHLNTQIGAIPSAFDTTRGVKDPAVKRRAYTLMLGSMTRVLRQAADKLEALAVPAAQQAVFKRYVQALRGIAAGLPSVPEALAHQDPRARERDQERAKARELAQQLGLQVCG